MILSIILSFCLHQTLVDSSQPRDLHQPKLSEVTMNFLSNWPILNMHTISSPLRHLLLNPTLLGRHTLVHPRSLVTQAKPVQSLLHGKKCIITGASRGIGAAIAKRFAAEGASCILIGRNEDLLRNIKGSLEAESGREEQDQHHRAVVGDVGSDEFWRSMKREVS